MNLINLLLMSLVIIFFHELGHVLHYYYITRRFPRLILKWWGVSVNIKGDLTARQKIINLLIAFVFGLIPTYLADTRLLYWLYFLGCSIDFIILLALIIIGIKCGYNIKLDEAYKKESK